MNPDEELLERCRRHLAPRPGRGSRPRLDWEAVVREWIDCRNQHTVAERLGLQQSRVSYILQKLGVQTGKTGRKPTHRLPMKEIGRRYEAGETCYGLGEEFGVDPEVIRRRLKRQGVPRRPQGPPRGNKNFQWKGGYQPPMHYHRRQSYEVAAICLGRPLPRGWVIHHIDENPKNNAPENLMVFPSLAAHTSYHQQLLGRQRAGEPADAIQTALENGAIRLPPPPAQFALPPDTGQRVPSKKKRPPVSDPPEYKQGCFAFALPQEPPQ